MIKGFLLTILRTLEYLSKHLARLAAFSAQTNMHTRNLALVWAPNLLRWVLTQLTHWKDFSHTVLYKIFNPSKFFLCLVIFVGFLTLKCVLSVKKCINKTKKTRENLKMHFLNDFIYQETKVAKPTWSYAKSNTQQ